jgi:hypothetical protein
VNQVFAGLVCGYLLAFAGAPALAIGLTRLRTSSALLQRLMPVGTPVVSLVVLLHGGLIMACTGTGILLGLLLLAMKDAGEALGSPNIAFTLFVFGGTVAVFAPFAFVLARFRAQVVAAALVVLVVFGWLMPYVAQWGRFGSS